MDQRVPRERSEFLAGQSGSQPADDQKLMPTLDILAQSIDLASTSLLEPGARRAVLFITPMAGMEELSTLQSLASRAIQLDVHVFVWVVAPADSPLAPGYQALIDLAEQTGGKLFLYSGSEALPSLAEYLAPLQSSYQLTYTSGLTSSGSHTLAVQVTVADGQIDLGPLEFEMDIQPPNPIMVSPPSQILRQYPVPGNYDTASLAPASQVIELIIEFPDGKPRPLASTSLIVDGENVAKNTIEPFDVFTWDLSGYTSNGRHEIQVMVVDVFGLQKTSISIPITVNIAETPDKLTIFLERYGQWLVMGAALLASLGLAVLLISITRRRRARKQASRTAIKQISSRSTRRQSICKNVQNKVSPTSNPYCKQAKRQAQGSCNCQSERSAFGSDPTKICLCAGRCFH